MWKWQGCQTYALAAFTPQRRYLVLISGRSWVNARAIVRPEGFSQWKTSKTPLGTKCATPSACNTVPQATVLSHVPPYPSSLTILSMYMHFKRHMVCLLGLYEQAFCIYAHYKSRVPFFFLSYSLVCNIPWSYCVILLATLGNFHLQVSLQKNVPAYSGAVNLTDIAKEILHKV
jgi:hypothetical protein